MQEEFNVKENQLMLWRFGSNESSSGLRKMISSDVESPMDAW